MLALGINKYSHSASLALADPSGKILFAIARERVTRKKFDGGDVAAALRYALERTGFSLGDIGTVVETCHLFRIAPFEKRLPFTVPLHYYAGTCLDEHNFAFPPEGVRKIEMSHHLAHAWAAMLCTPFDEGLIVVMDGMGSLRSDMTMPGEPLAKPPNMGVPPMPPHRKPETVLSSATATGETPVLRKSCASALGVVPWHTDLELPRAPGFREVPESPDDRREWREAETAYLFKGGELSLLFKRWTPLRSPQLLHNYGFEDMESLGALHSRAASHIFGDWNACGKVMGLSAYGTPGGPAFEGPLEELKVHWDYFQYLPHVNDWNEDAPRAVHRDLAATVQADLERVGLDFLRRLRERNGAENLILTGGVALNSQFNGRVACECGFANVFVPSSPGDDGAAIGCAAFGASPVMGRVLRCNKAYMAPFLGGAHSDEEIEGGLAEYADRIAISRPEDLLGETARLLAEGKVVGWFQGRSEFGPRALGSRSILAHPGLAGMVERLNKRVKGRESFRPFAPSVLAERAGEFFEPTAPSPYMSFTFRVRPDRRADIPAVTHVDGTSRIQTLRREDNPLYYDLIQRFESLTGLPLVLNTSFNLAGEPIVEAPAEAAASFLRCDMDALAVGPFLATKRPFPAGENLFSATAACTPDLLVETVCHPDGAVEKATLFARGSARECGWAELEWVERCAEPSNVGRLLAEMEAEGMDRGEMAEALKRLFEDGFVTLR